MGAALSLLKRSSAKPVTVRIPDQNQQWFQVPLLMTGTIVIIVTVLQGQAYNLTRYIEESRTAGTIRKHAHTPHMYVSLATEVLKDMQSKEVGRKFMYTEKEKPMFFVCTLENMHDFKSMKRYIDPSNPRRLLVYQNVGYEVEHRGHRGFRAGPAVGIPRHFHYSCVQDLSPTDEEIFSECASSLVLSEDSKKFALAREIAWVQSTPSLITQQLWFCAAVGGCIIIILKSRIHVSLKLLLLIVLHQGYIKAQAALKASLAKKMDRLSASVGDGYRRGGIEFYEKLKERREYLEKKVGVEKSKRILYPQGAIEWSVLGNFVANILKAADLYFYAADTLPPIDRLELLRKLTEETEQEASEPESVASEPESVASKPESVASKTESVA